LSAPPPDTEAAVETPPAAPRPGRSRRRLAALIAGGVLGGLLALVIVLMVGGRMYLVTGPGRELVTSFVAGKSLGRFGRINVEGLSGDLFDDFGLDRVTVEDERGVWLELRDVRVDWSYWPLLTRRFHADRVEAGLIRVIRRPDLPPSEGPSGGQPLSIDIDAFAADVELLEGFSQTYGRWRLAGEADLPRRGERQVRLAADSLSREGDFLRLDARLGDDPADLRLDLTAEESQGGPIAGALGYPTDQPFMARALVNGRDILARVRTGRFTPLVVQGAYGPDGARVSGFADFSGSDLLAPFVDRVGRTARFGFAAVPVRDSEEQGVAWRLLADNVQSTARGVVRMSDRSVPDGLEITLASPSLSRVVGRPLAGATRYAGVFRGDADRWRLEGEVDVSSVDAAGWQARGLSGPLALAAEDGRLELSGELQAAGGADGPVGGLLGPTPSLGFTVWRSREGAIALDRVELASRSLQVDGRGGRALTGGLTFDGDIVLTRLAALRPGAAGEFRGRLRATAARPGAVWQVGFEGRGRSLQTGFAELDRLLGDQPAVQLGGSLGTGPITIERLALTGEHVTAGARGLIREAGELALALDWQAEGPFGVGPLEIEGAATGEGALTGPLAQPRLDLTADFARVAAGPLTLTNADLTLSFRRGADASDGRITVVSGSNYGPARASGAFRLTEGGVQLSEVALDAGGVQAEGAIALNGTTPASADLSFTAGPGAFLSAGRAEGRVRLTETAAAGAAVLDVSARNVRFAGSSYVIQSLDLDGQGSLDRLPFTIDARVGGPTPVALYGSGVYARSGAAQTLTLSGGGQVREVPFTTRTPAVVALSGAGRVARVDLTVGGGILMGELRTDDTATLLQADLTSVELASMFEDLAGRVSGRVTLRGAGDDLTGAANVTLREVRSVDGGVSINGRLDAQLLDDRLMIDASIVDEGVVRAGADLTLPVEASAAPLRLAVNRTRPISGDVFANGQVQPLWDLFIGGGRTLAGVVDGRADVGGTLANPRLNGSLSLADGSFRDSASGLELRQLTLDSRFDDEAAVIQSFSARDEGDGRVEGSGRLNLRQGGGSTFTLNLDGFTIIDNELATAQASGPVTATRGADGNIALVGRIEIDDAIVRPNLPGSSGIVPLEVVEINRPGGDPPEDAVRGPRGPTIGLDVTVRAPGPSVQVTGRGLNVFLSLNARVTGALTAPNLSGTARVVRGDYEFGGKRFVFDDTGSVTLSTNPENIRLNLSAVREDPALTATIRVTGTAARPDIALTSSPALPQDEVLAQVLFGRSASQLSAFEAAQLASGVASLAGGGGFDIIGNLRELAGLDRLSFGGEASALTVAGGRYISDDVYLEIIGGGEGGAGVNVEWQVRRNLAVTSSLGGQGQASLSIRWRRESRPPGADRTDRRPNRRD
jgi:translocation and assembly module TamB